MRNPPKKKMFGHSKSRAGRIARALTLSFYPTHMDILKQRENELGIHRSILLQLLLETEFRDGILRRELIGRLTQPQTRGRTGRPVPIKYDQNPSNGLAHRHD